MASATSRPLRERSQLNYSEKTPAKWKTPARLKKGVKQVKPPAVLLVEKENTNSFSNEEPNLSAASTQTITIQPRKRGRPKKAQPSTKEHSMETNFLEPSSKKHKIGPKETASERQSGAKKKTQGPIVDEAPAPQVDSDVQREGQGTGEPATRRSSRSVASQPAEWWAASQSTKVVEVAQEKTERASAADTKRQPKVQKKKVPVLPTLDNATDGVAQTKAGANSSRATKHQPKSSAPELLQEATQASTGVQETTSPSEPPLLKQSKGSEKANKAKATHKVGKEAAQPSSPAGTADLTQRSAFHKLQEVYKKLQEQHNQLKAKKFKEAEALFEEQQKRVAAHVQASDKVIEHWKSEAARLLEELRKAGVQEKDEEIRRLRLENAELKDSILSQEQKYLEVQQQHAALGQRLEIADAKLAEALGAAEAVQVAAIRPFLKTQGMQTVHPRTAAKTTMTTPELALANLVSQGCNTESVREVPQVQGREFKSSEVQSVEVGCGGTPGELGLEEGSGAQSAGAWRELAELAVGCKVELCESGRAVFHYEDIGFSFMLSQRLVDDCSEFVDDDGASSLWGDESSEPTGGLEMRYRPLAIGRLGKVLAEDDVLLGEGDIPVHDVPLFLARVVRTALQCKSD